MRKSTILFLISSIVVLFSCTTNKVVNDCKTIDKKQTTYSNLYFSKFEMDYVYKANISVYGKELSGVFIAKKLNDFTHRVVFTTEFGNKLLDFEISDTTFKINSIADELNKNIIINTLKTDFGLLFKNQFVVNEQLENSFFDVYASNNNNKINYIFQSKSHNLLTKIVHSSKRKEKFSINFTSKNNTFASEITIKHKNSNLVIHLKFLDNN